MATDIFYNFSPQDYLTEYYSKIGPENYALLEFFTQAFKDLEPSVKMLEVGGGPTVYQLITACSKVQEIHFSDYSDANLEEVKKWLSDEKEAFDWKSFFEQALAIELGRQPTDDETNQRQALMKAKITEFLHCDAFKPDPVGSDRRETYDVIGMHFIAEGITDNRGEWSKLMTNLLSPLRPEGTLVMSTITGGTFWKVGNHTYPAVNISHQDIIAELESQNFQVLMQKTIDAEVLDVNDPDFEGYTGMSFVKGVKQVSLR